MMNKTIISLLSFISVMLCNIGLAQEKNCNSVNIPGKRCNVQIISNNTDTIKCIVEDDCYTILYDMTKNATWITYSKDTSQILEIISFCNEKQTKNHTQFYSDGKLKCQSNYENGELIGPYLSFYENGKIKRSGTHINGHFIGTIYKYWDNGTVAEVQIQTETSYCKKYVTYYDPLGNSISETVFKQLWNCNY